MSLPGYISRVAVSSVLNKDTQRYGKQFLFDGKPETCWESDTGGSQWIRLNFAYPVKISSVQLQFQGGFAAEEASLQLWNDSKDNKTTLPFYPTNSNSVQTFEFFQDRPFSNAAIVFRKATDFYGRIIVYKLDFTFA